MKREIKFRAWDSKYKTMLCNGFSIIGEVTLFRGVELTLREISKANNDTTSSLERLNDAVIMQYTGLKDKNGKEIYEGDILNLHLFTEELGACLGVSEGEVEYKGVIGFGELGLMLTMGEGEDNWFYLIYSPGMLHEESYEIIGNIYENPELINQ